MSALGVVAIARNEGERLRRCLVSLRERGKGATIVYVDSGSTDGSVEVAQGLGIDVVALDLSIPFTAARARNEGFARLVELEPNVNFVQFLDGDCEVAEEWLDRARKTLQEQINAVVVFGKRRERFPEKSLYNRLADVEWDMAIGSTGPDGTPEACGGDAMFRVEAFRAVNGFDPSVPAGEEPELCQRLRARGGSVVRLDADMTWHDSAMLKFGQWAKRQFRTGYGGLDFSTRFGKNHGHDDPFRRQIVSARVWSLGWPLVLVCVTALVATIGGPVAAIVAALILLMAPVAQAVRIALKNRGRTGTLFAATAYGGLTMLAKPFHLAGQCLYLRDHCAGRHARLIEYKSPAPLSS